MADTSQKVRGLGIIALIVLAFAGSVVSAVLWDKAADDRRNQICASVVQGRNDNRAMWVYLVAQNPDSPEVPAFVKELNKRLPVLTCEHGNAVPVEAPR